LWNEFVESERKALLEVLRSYLNKWFWVGHGFQLRDLDTQNTPAFVPEGTRSSFSRSIMNGSSRLLCQAVTVEHLLGVKILHLG
jgi:hypothetical protein